MCVCSASRKHRPALMSSPNKLLYSSGEAFHHNRTFCFILVKSSTGFDLRGKISEPPGDARPRGPGGRRVRSFSESAVGRVCRELLVAPDPRWAEQQNTLEACLWNVNRKLGGGALCRVINGGGRGDGGGGGCGMLSSCSPERRDGRSSAGP